MFLCAFYVDYFCIIGGDNQESKFLPDPSRSLRMYSSELSSNASSSAPNQVLQANWSGSLITECFHVFSAADNKCPGAIGWFRVQSNASKNPITTC